MFVALNINNKRVGIENAAKGEMYFCPCCRESVTVRMGEVRIHHFAHLPERNNSSVKKDCEERTYGKYYEMSEWHKEWQREFDEEQRERWFEGKEGERQCRADVYLADEKKVIEFQHSNLPLEEFERRNKFYNDKGIHVIWLFDFNPLFKSNKLAKMSLWNFSENRQKILKDKNQWVYSINCYEKMFGNLIIQEMPNIEIFFSYTDEKGIERIRKIVWISRGFNEITTENVGSRNQFINACKEHVHFYSKEELAEKKRLADEKRAKEKALAEEKEKKRKKEQERFYKERAEEQRKWQEEQLRLEEIERERQRKTAEEDSYIKESLKRIAQNEVNELDVLNITNPASQEKYESFIEKSDRLIASFFKICRIEYVLDRKDEYKDFYFQEAKLNYSEKLKTLAKTYGYSGGSLENLIQYIGTDSFIQNFRIDIENITAWFTEGGIELRKVQSEIVKNLTIDDNAPEEVIEAYNNADQDERFIMYGTRWIQCTGCHKIMPEKFFTVYGGEGTINKGQCEKCFRSKPIEQMSRTTEAKPKKDWSKICPECSSELVLRNGRYGPFYACTNRNCRYTRSARK